MTSFGTVESIWTDRLGSLRNVVRQRVIAAQLSEHLGAVSTALDVGCGQGTQAVLLAAGGLQVTGVDPSSDLLQRLDEAADAAGVEVRTLAGTLDDLDALLPDEQFDLVCAHGLLMYLPGPEAALPALAKQIRPGGLLSFTMRNGDALALRPGLRGQWAKALAAFDDMTYVNELGADAEAHRLEDVLGWCERAGLSVEAWYGVRVFTDGREAAEAPDPDTLQECLAAEVEAGRRDPYRRVGSQIHIIARA
ncbi:methyltransferase domain-containing protein [Nocardioides sp. NPDC006273]|uniref:class I SAM-dependent methyltransferase n=1 Tax=Nocardioides sp. NPDC006273 TaxID=3155598 RepID=UPI0033AE61C5